MLKKGEHIEGTPTELQVLLNKNKEEKTFFETLSKSYKQGIAIGLVLLNRKQRDKSEQKKH